MDQPNSGAADLETRILDVLDLIRPAIKEDGGDVEFVEISDQGMVQLRFLGACVGCPSSAHTLHQGIERLLRDRVPEVTGVESLP